MDVQDWEILEFDNDGGSPTTNTASTMNYFTSPQKQSAENPANTEVVDIPFSTNCKAQLETAVERTSFGGDSRETEDKFNMWILSLVGVATAGVWIIISCTNSNKNHQHKTKKT